MKHARILTALALLALITACNTMDGLGQDVQKGGENLSNSAERHK